MALRLKIVSRQRQGLGERSVKEFGRDGGTIGRSLDCDWPLPDGHRYVSSRHASIDYHSGSYYIVDTSTNGVYVNDSDTPVGKGNPQRLFDGDRIRIGDYEFAVEIDDEGDVEIVEGNADPINFAERVPPPDPTRADLLQAHEIAPLGIALLVDEQANSERIRMAQQRSAELSLADDPPPPRHVSSLLDNTAAGALATAPAKPAAEPATEIAPPKHTSEPPPVSAAAHVKPKPAASRPDRTAQAAATPPPAAKQAAETHSSKAPARNAETAKPAAPVKAAAPSMPSTPSTYAGATSAAAAPAPAAKSAAPAQPKTAVVNPVTPPSPPTASGTAAAAAAFFRGAGISGEHVNDEQATELMQRLGQLVREMIVGLSENLHVRADQKSALRVPNTTIQPRANNPLKFSAGVDEALRNLLLRQPAEYLSAVEAVREAFRDVKVHQQSLLAALRTAIGDYLTRLDPEDIESKYSGAKRGGLISAANKLRYWDLYKDLYQVVTQAPPGQMPQLLVEDLLRAYEREVAKAAGALAKKSQAQAG